MKHEASALLPLTEWERACLREGYGSPAARAALEARDRALQATADVLAARERLAPWRLRLQARPLPAHVAAAVAMLVDRNDNSGVRRLWGDEAEAADVARRVRDLEQLLAAAERAHRDALSALEAAEIAR